MREKSKISKAPFVSPLSVQAVEIKVAKEATDKERVSGTAAPSSSSSSSDNAGKTATNTPVDQSAAPIVAKPKTKKEREAAAKAENDAADAKAKADKEEAEANLRAEKEAAAIRIKAEKEAAAAADVKAKADKAMKAEVSKAEVGS